jgi:hypothetical protein
MELSAAGKVARGARHPVRNQRGIPFGFTPESRSPCPDSAGRPQCDQSHSIEPLGQLSYCINPRGDILSRLCCELSSISRLVWSYLGRHQFARAQSCPANANDDTTFLTGGSNGTTFWSVAASAANQNYNGGTFQVDGYSASDYYKCDCTSVGARWFSADSESSDLPNVTSSTGGGSTYCQYWMSFSFSGPVQMLNACPGGSACQTTGAVEATPTEEYDVYQDYWSFYM